MSDEISEQKILQSHKFVRCCERQDLLNVFGRILFCPSIRSLNSSSSSFMETQMKKTPYFGLGLSNVLGDVKDSPFQIRQKISLQRHVVLTIDMSRNLQRKSLARGVSEKILRSSPSEIISMISRLQISPYSLMTEIRKINPKFEIPSEVQDFLHQSDFQSVSATTLLHSSETEILFESLLKSFGLTFKTEKELKEEYFKLYGHIPQKERTVPLVTPDILLDEPVVVCRDKTYHQVFWLELKNYYGSRVGVFYKNTAKQVSKYVSKFGPGAIVYSLGSEKRLKFDGCVILDFYFE